MNEGHKTSLAFLGIFAFLGLAIFFQADITTHLGLETEQEPDTLDQTQETNRQASTQFTESFEGELGPEYVFDIETESLEFSHSEDNREYYEASLRFELTEFGEQVLQTSTEEEVKELVEESFQTYPEGEYAPNLIADVDAVNEGRISDLEREALTGNLEEFSENNGQANIVISVQEGENAEIKWGSFSTVWTMSTEETSAEALVNVDESGAVQTDDNGVIQNVGEEDDGEQTQFYTDFSEYEDTDDITEYDWSNHWEVDGINFAVEEGTISWSDWDTDRPVGVSWDKVPDDVSDAEVFATIEDYDSEEQAAYVYTNAEEAEGGDMGVAYGGGYNKGTNTDEARISYDGSAEAWEVIDINTPYHIRFRAEEVNGENNLKLKIWEVGDNEPDWQLELENDELGSGNIVIGDEFYETSGFTVSEFSVGIGGENAPTEPVE